MPTTDTQELETQAPTTEQRLNLAESTLTHAQLYIKSLEDILGRAIPGWDKWEDDQVNANIEAIHKKNLLTKQREAAAIDKASQLQRRLNTINSDHEKTMSDLRGKMANTIARLEGELVAAKGAG